MSLAITKVTVWAGLLGLLVGFAASAFAHSGNGFESGPLVLLTLTVSVVGVLVSAVLVFVFGNRSQTVSGLGAFSFAMLFVLVVAPLVWPYPQLPGPVPLDSSQGSSEPK
jgi:hypothetical protein